MVPVGSRRCSGVQAMEEDLLALNGDCRHRSFPRRVACKLAVSSGFYPRRSHPHIVRPTYRHKIREVLFKRNEVRSRAKFIGLASDCAVAPGEPSHGPLQRLPVPRSSEYPAFRRGHCEVGRPFVRKVSILSPCGQPGGESSQVSCRP